jgi:hypothetical protein
MRVNWSSTLDTTVVTRSGGNARHMAPNSAMAEKNRVISATSPPSLASLPDCMISLATAAGTNLARVCKPWRILQMAWSIASISWNLELMGLTSSNRNCLTNSVFLTSSRIGANNRSASTETKITDPMRMITEMIADSDKSRLAAFSREV